MSLSFVWERLKCNLKKHWLAICISFFVGLICVAPQIIFILSLGGQYHGIYMSQSPNEVSYLAIMQEIVDGHWTVASMPFWEYKDAVSLLPATIAFLYTIPTLLFGVSLIFTIIASKFILPAILFFLVYLLIWKLISEEDGILAKMHAVVGGLLVVLGFDLVGYRTIFSYLFQGNSPQGFLIWTRPVNPISGAILLMIFLLCLFTILKKRKIYLAFIAAAALALMMSSYFFSWSLALVFIGLLGFRALILKDFQLVKYFLITVLLGFLFSLPYWIKVIVASKMPWYEEASARIGLLYTHQPHLNLFLLAVFIFFAISSFLAFKNKFNFKNLPEWWWFALILILSGFIVYNQQVLTGREIWYFHYVFYTIPLGYIVLMLILWHQIKPKFFNIWKVLLFAVCVASLGLGIFQQVSAYRNSFPRYKEMQKLADVFEYLNENTEKDSVVLVKENEIYLSTIVPAFTHCNVYFSGDRESVLAPPERFYHNYLTLLRIRGITPTQIPEFMKQNRQEAVGALRFNLYNTLGFSDSKLDDLLTRLEKDYESFYQKDFREQLSKYRIDYILSSSALSVEVYESLFRPEIVFDKNGYYIYKL